MKHVAALIVGTPVVVLLMLALETVANIVATHAMAILQGSVVLLALSVPLACGYVVGRLLLDEVWK